MNERIRKIMNYKGLSPSELADSIDVQRSNVTHVLQGRNKPGFFFITKLLETFPELNARWLITGTGEMISGNEGEVGPRQPSLFGDGARDENPGHGFEKVAASGSVTADIDPALDDNMVKHEDAPYYEKKKNTGTSAQTIEKSEKKTARVESVVIFYDDGTFRQYLNNSSEIAQLANHK